MTRIGFWSLSSSTYLFGIKFLILGVAFAKSHQMDLLRTLYHADGMYFVFEWMMDLLFYLAVILFVWGFILKVMKK